MSPLPIYILSKMLLHAVPIIIPIGKPKQQKYIFFFIHLMHLTQMHMLCSHTLCLFRTSPKGTTTKKSDAFCSSFLGGLSLVRVSPRHSGDGWMPQGTKGTLLPFNFLNYQTFISSFFICTLLIFALAFIHSSIVPHSFIPAFKSLIHNTSYSHTT